MVIVMLHSQSQVAKITQIVHLCWVLKATQHKLSREA